MRASAVPLMNAVLEQGLAFALKSAGKGYLTFEPAAALVASFSGRKRPGHEATALADEVVKSQRTADS